MRPAQSGLVEAEREITHPWDVQGDVLDPGELGAIPASVEPPLPRSTNQPQVPNDQTQRGFPRNHLQSVPDEWNAEDLRSHGDPRVELPFRPNHADRCDIGHPLNLPLPVGQDAPHLLRCGVQHRNSDHFHAVS